MRVASLAPVLRDVTLGRPAASAEFQVVYTMTDVLATPSIRSIGSAVRTQTPAARGTVC
jgi:hypothetical protein